MYLTQSEKIRLVRWRLRLTQFQFYGITCSMGEARYIENKDKYENIEQHLKSKNTLWNEHRYAKSYNRVIKKLDAKYSLDIVNLTIAEKARILRQRAGDTIEDAAKKLGRSHEWISRIEGGLIYAYRKTSEDNAQKLYDLYKS